MGFIVPAVGVGAVEEDLGPRPVALVGLCLREDVRGDGDGRAVRHRAHYSPADPLSIRYSSASGPETMIAMSANEASGGAPRLIA